MAVHASDLARMFEVAEDDEIPTLTEVAERAGLIVTCPRCNWTNEQGDTDKPWTCENCDLEGLD